MVKAININLKMIVDMNKNNNNENYKGSNNEIPKNTKIESKKQ